MHIHVAYAVHIHTHIYICTHRGMYSVDAAHTQRIQWLTCTNDIDEIQYIHMYMYIYTMHSICCISMPNNSQAFKILRTRTSLGPTWVLPRGLAPGSVPGVTGRPVPWGGLGDLHRPTPTGPFMQWTKEMRMVQDGCRDRGGSFSGHALWIHWTGNL